MHSDISLNQHFLPVTVVVKSLSQSYNSCQMYYSKYYVRVIHGNCTPSPYSQHLAYNFTVQQLACVQILEKGCTEA